MAIHSSTLAWKISWAEETGGLQSMKLRQSITRQVDKKSRVPEEEKGSGALKEEIRVWKSQGREKDKHFFYIP